MRRSTDTYYCKYCGKMRTMNKYSTRYQKCRYCIAASKGLVDSELELEATYKAIHELTNRVTPPKRTPYRTEPVELTEKRKRILAQRELDKINEDFEL